MIQVGVDLRGSRVLVIGSSESLNGLRHGELVDDYNEYDVVVRCNKPYGDEIDVGRRADLVFVRYGSWLEKYWDTRQILPHVVINQGEAGRSLARLAAAEVGVTRASCGLSAVFFAVIHGAHVSVMGFGRGEGVKKYPDGTEDHNDRYEFKKEYEWIKRNAVIIEATRGSTDHA